MNAHLTLIWFIIPGPLFCSYWGVNLGSSSILANKSSVAYGFALEDVISFCLEG